jgi:hypothetical protein
VPPKASRRVLRVADSNNERPFDVRGATRVVLPVEVPRGHSRLLLKTDPPATSVADAVAISAPRAESTTSAPQLRADLISANPGY